MKKFEANELKLDETRALIALRYYFDIKKIRSHLKKRILAQGQGGTEFQPADILKYVEDLKPGPNTETCPPLADWAKRLF